MRNDGGADTSPFVNSLIRFLNGKVYPILIGLFAFLSHLFGLEMLFASSVLILASVSLLVCSSIRPTLVAMLFTPYFVSREHGPGVPLFSDYLSSAPCVLILVILISLFAVSVGVFAIKRGFFKIKIKDIPCIFPLVFLTLALSLGGALSHGYSVADGLFGFALGLSFLLPYALVFLSLTTSHDEGILNYFALLSALSLAVVIAEVVALYVLNPQISKEEILFGWGTWTHAGVAITVRIPLLFLRAESPIIRRLYLFLAAASQIALFMTMSRGAVCIGLLVFILSLFSRIPEKARKKVALGLSSSLLAIVLIVLSSHTLRVTLSSFLSDNGRFAIWRRALDYFLSSPLFGKGYFSLNYGSFEALVGMPDMAHNTILQLLSATGLSGLFSYAIYRISTIKLLLKAPADRSFLLALSVLALLLGSLLDNFVFYITPLFHYSSVLAISAFLDRNSSHHFD